MYRYQGYSYPIKQRQLSVRVRTIFHCSRQLHFNVFFSTKISTIVGRIDSCFKTLREKHVTCEKTTSSTVVW